MKLSKEAQNLANSTVLDEIAISQREKDALYSLVLKSKNATPKVEHVAPALSVVRGRKIKPVYLIAAAIATMGLLGAGYATSLYFDKLYQRGTGTPTEYNVFVDNSEHLIDPIVSDNAVPVVNLDKMGRLYLGPVFDGKSPGEVFDVEIHTPNRKAMAQGVKGKGINLISSVTDQGEPGMNAVVNTDQSPSTQAVIDKMIANGKFIVTMNHPAFEPVQYWQGFYQELHYSDGKDTNIGLTFNPHFSGAGEMPESVYDNAKPEDLTINGNHFVLMKMGDSYLADLYLGDNGKYITNTVTISFGRYAKDRENVMEILGTIQVHNLTANKMVIGDAAFFHGVSQPSIGDNAAEIASAIRTQAGSEDTQVWQKDDLSVTSSRGGWMFALTAKESFGAATTLYPYGGQHTAITEQSWFQKDKFTALTVNYEGIDPVCATHSSTDGKYQLVSTLSDNGYVQNPLDAILAEAGNGGLYLRVDRLINSGSENPFAVMSDPNGNVAVFSARKLSDGKFLVEKLAMTTVDLPQELF